MAKGKKKATAVVAAMASKPRPEVTAVLALLGVVFVGLSLGSYDGLGADGLPSGSNMMGVVGRYAAFVVLQLVGLAAGYYLALLAVLGVIWFTETRHDVTLGTLLAYLANGVLLAALLHLGAPEARVLGHELGGSAGELLGGLLSSLFSVWGGGIVAAGLVMVLVVVATPRPLLAFAKRIGRGLFACGRGLRHAAGWSVGVWRASRARHREEAADSPFEIVEAEPQAGPQAEPQPKPRKGKAARVAEPPAAAEPAVEEPLPERVFEVPTAAPPRPVEPIIHQRPRMSAPAPAAGASDGREREVLSGLAQAMSRPAEDEIERVIEAARAAGFFDVDVPRTPADVPPAATPPVPEVAAVTPAVEPVIVEGPRRRKGTRKSGTLAAENQGEAPASRYELPGLELLADPPEQATTVAPEVLRDYAAKLTQTLKNYGIEGEVREIHPGPVVTTYEFCPAAGTRLSRISSLENDVAMSMAVTKVRIVAPIPGKNAVGFEIPNPTRETVFLKELMADPAFAKRGGMLPIAIGKDLTGKPYYSDLAKMPHLLVAGATGTGKSVFINATLVSLLYRQTAEQMRLLLIDPKHVELIAYDRIPHLLLPVVSDMRKAALALRWAVGEMERRYHLFASIGARQLTHYNQKLAAMQDGTAAAADRAAGGGVRIVVKGPDGTAREVAPVAAPPTADQPLEKLPALVIVIDELAELMSVAAKDVESAIQRLAQKGRAAGIHLIVATQRPSVDVITGTIKANFPTRLSFKVSSKTDSRTVLDQNGADQLLGMGDMLLLPPGTSDLLRIQACYVGEDEIERVAQHVRVQGEPTYDESIVAEPDEDDEEADGEGEDYDEHWEPALELTLRLKQASISKIQRHLRIGYNRAARIVERMEREGLVGPGSNPREKEIYADRIQDRLSGERDRRDAGADDRPVAPP